MGANEKSEAAWHGADMDALRAEVERLTLVARTQWESSGKAIAEARARAGALLNERDAAVREAAALRARVEAVIDAQGRDGFSDTEAMVRIVRILADPTPEADRG